MAKIQIKNSFITSSADITISSSMVKFSSGISAKNITGSFSGSIPALTSYYKQGGNSFGTTAILGTNDNQALSLETNGSEKVRIDTNGNVGIGTTSTGAPLTVYRASNPWIYLNGGGNFSYIRFNDGTSNAYLFKNTNSDTTNGALAGAMYTYTESGKAFQHIHAGTPLFTILSGGNVGIGTTNPNGKLHVVSTDSTYAFSVAGATKGVRFNINSAGTYIQGVDNTLAGSYQSLILGGSDLYFQTNGVTTAMYINSSGNVGIGTTSPGYKLQAYNSSNGTTAAFGGTAYGVRIDNGGTFSSGRSTIFGVDNTFYASYQPLCIGASTLAFSISGTDKVTIDTAGNVGIGTTSPSALLHVYNGSSHFEATSTGAAVLSSGVYALQIAPLHNRITTAGTYYGGIAFNHLLNFNGGTTYNGAPQAWIGTRLQDTAGSERDYLVFATKPGTGTSGAGNDIPIERMCIDRDGLVGINITSPLAKLHVTAAGADATSVKMCGSGGSTNGNFIYSLATDWSDSFGLNVFATAHSANLARTNTLVRIHSNETSIGGLPLRVTAQGSIASPTYEALSVNYLGYVGIGTTSPNQKLSIYPGTTGGIALQDSGGTTRSYFFIDNTNPIYSTGIRTENYYLDFDSSGGAQNAIRFYTGTSGIGTGTERMRITSTGNVGIGTSTTTNGLLSLHATYPQLVANNPTTGSGVVIQLKDNGRDAGFMGHSTTTARLQFGSKGSSAAHMTISETGDVGIGTTAPTAQANYRFLQVNGTNSAVIETMVGGTRIGGFDSSATALYVGSIGSYPIVFRTAVNEKMRLDTSGNLLIGNSSGTGYRLNVKSAFASAVGGAYIEVGEFNQKTLVINNTNPSVSSNLFEAQKSGSAVFVVNSSANLGIGTSNATNILTIYNSSTPAIDFNTGTSTSRGRISATSSDFTLAALTSSPLVFKIDTSEKVRIAADGNVGIGTTSVNYKLDLSTALTGTTVGSNVVLNIESQASGRDVEIRLGDTVNSSKRLGYLSGNFYIASGTTENFRIDLNGNVGIGTSSPGAKLDVNGDVYISPNTAGKNTFILSTNASNDARLLMRSDTTTKVDIQANGTSYFNGGNVGIGTTSPAYKLDVNGAIGVGGLRFLDLSTNYFRIFEPAGNIAIYLGNAADPSNYFDNTNHVFRNRGGSSVYALINSNGNLGIGTTSPTTKLAVSDGTTIAQVNPSSNVAYFGTVNNYPMALSVNSSEKVRVDTNGNVGIGTSSPSRPFHVYSSNNAPILLQGTTAGAWLDFQSSTSNLLSIGADGTNGIGFYNRTTSTNLVTISNGGNVGIGTTSPVSKLHIEQIQNAESLITLRNDRQDFGDVAIFGITAQNGVQSVSKISFYRGGGGSSGYLTFSTKVDNASSLTEKVRIDGAGNVGIGTTAPAYKLHVSGSITAAGGSNSRFLSIVTSGTDKYFLDCYGTSGRQIFALYENSSNAYLNSWSTMAFRANQNGGSGGYFTFSGGNIGVGSTPSGILDIQSSNTGDQLVRTWNTDTSGTGKSILRIANSGNNAQGTQLQFTDLNYFVGTIATDRTNGMAFYVGQQATALVSERMRIDINGNVGIGTTSLTAKLQIASTNNQAAIYTTGATTGFTYLQIQNSGGSNYFGMSASNGAFWSTTPYTSYHATIGTAANIPLTFTTNNLIRMLLDNSGNLGIGTTSPKNKLHVAGLVTLDSTIIYSKVNNVTTNNPIRITIPFTKVGTGGDFIVRVKAVSMADNSSGVNYLDYVGYSGYTFNFNTNLTTIEKLGSVVVNSYVSASSATAGNLYIELNGDDGFTQDSNWTIQTDIMGNSRYATFDSGSITTFATSISEDNLQTSFNKVFGGNVGIGTSTPGAKLNTYASGSNLSVFKVDGGNGTLFEVTDQLSGSLFSVNDVSGLPLLEVFSNNRIVAGKYGSNALVISGSSVGIGTTTPAYKLQVNGSFGATTKSFVIDHPTKEGKKLVYGSLESPYHGIRLTGRNMLIDGECKVQLPDYIYKLARSESVNIQITPIKCGKVIYVDEISVENNYFVVKYDKSLLESYKNYEFFWDFTATRSDVEQLVVEQ